MSLQVVSVILNVLYADIAMASTGLNILKRLKTNLRRRSATRLS